MKELSDKKIEKILHELENNKEAAVRLIHTPEAEKLLSEEIDKDLRSVKIGTEELWIPHPVPSNEMRQALNKQISVEKEYPKTTAWWKVAAILVPFLMMAAFAFYVNRNADIFGASPMKTIEVKHGEKIRLMFQDGSTVFANSGSKIVFPEKFGLKQRVVQLQGEAYFDVAKNRKRPFIVQLQEAQVKVLGTQFNVKDYPSEEYVRISLDNGSVAFSQNGDMPQTVLKPGEILIFNKKSGEQKISLIAENNDSQWTIGKLSFTNQSFTEISQILQRQFNVHFRITDPRANNVLFTFSSDKNASLEAILADFERVSPLRFVMEDEEVAVGVAEHEASGIASTK